MSKLLISSETAGYGATIELDNREVVYVSIARGWVLVRLWNIRAGFILSTLSNFFGRNLYNERDLFTNIRTANALSVLFPEAVPSLDFENPMLAAFAKALWHSKSAAEVARILNEASGKVT